MMCCDEEQPGAPVERASAARSVSTRGTSVNEGDTQRTGCHVAAVRHGNPPVWADKTFHLSILTREEPHLQ
eukprot:297290-Rhodomonas_salina.1